MLSVTSSKSSLTLNSTISSSALPDSIFRKNSCRYDMMYATQDTPFMQWSASCGAEDGEVVAFATGGVGPWSYDFGNGKNRARNRKYRENNETQGSGGVL